MQGEVSRLHQVFEESRSSYEIRINIHVVEINELHLTVMTQKTEIDGLWNELDVRKDVQEQIFMVRQHHDQIFSAKAELQKELDTAADYINELEKKYLKSQETSIELLKHLKNAEFEIETLKQYIIDLKSRIAVYIPMKGDLIDKRLAEYINNFPDRQKLKIMFMRESEGIYQFGTKRVSVKVEKDKINIRVGGGYLSIDEFLDQYTPVELEKLERKDPLKRFNEKIAVQKTIVGKEVRESSPIRGSPRK